MDSQEQKNKQLCEATLRNDWEKVVDLLNSGADVKTDDSLVLRISAFLGVNEIVALALEKGADLSVKDYSPYMWARVREAKDMDSQTADVIRQWAKNNNVGLQKLDERSLDAFKEERKRTSRNAFKPKP